MKNIKEIYLDLMLWLRLGSGSTELYGAHTKRRKTKRRKTKHRKTKRRKTKRRTTKRRHIITLTHQNVDNYKMSKFFLLSAMYKYWFIDHNMKCTVCVVIIFRRIFCICISFADFCRTIKLSESIQTF
jgi:hypothetical protein